ncbi:MAG: molybdenum cofactor guanylyltransferase [Myxococcales bacterium]|nr:molybdenum cofactor guanylyltransferase [Myxococcales bacterium]
MSWTAIVLAGGKASRFGSDKTRAILHGTPLLERTVSSVAPSVGRVIVVGRSCPRDWPPHLEEVQFVLDTVPHCGPLGGIVTACSLLNEPFLVAAADLGALESECVRWLLGEFRPDYDVVAVQSSRGLEPLLAIYSPSVLAPAQRAIEGGNLSLTKLLERLAVFRCDLPSRFRHCTHNVNFPEDLDELQ